jgi:hypothetical protein
MSDKNTVWFLPNHIEHTEEQHIDAITKYRAWLDQHGRYGKLYMMNQDRKRMKLYEDIKFETPIVGVDIYDGEIALLFRLQFNL